MTAEELIELESDIESDRERLQIARVTLHKMPAWAKRRIIAVAGHRSITNIEYCIPGPRIFDHWGCSPAGSLVGEPYSRVSDNSLERKVRQIADGLGVQWSISNAWTSWWFPEKTIRVEFFETEDSIPVDELRANAKAARKQDRCLFGFKYSSLPPSM